MASSHSTLKPLILHSHASGPNPPKVAIVLEVLGIPYTVKTWQFGDGINGVKGPVFTKINPNGRVPALQDSNTDITSWESGAVINYLLRVYDKQNVLGPRRDSEQAHVEFDKWIFFLLSSLGPMQGQVNWFAHFHPSKNEDALTRYREQTLRTYGVLEGQLESHGGLSVLPQGFSAVDAHFIPWVKIHGFAGVDLAPYPHVSKWLEAMLAKEEVKAAYERIGSGENV
ncbi:MAG: hypothetical protein M1838_002824 [Thelocarpon superellum]|nr:MAG: hypothetical protein M1838_002824 [Thelocarpon superellum]